MKIATTTSDFSRYCTTDAERIHALHAAGFRYIDLSMYSLSPASPLMSDNWSDEVKKLKDLVDELGMKFVQAHAPGTNYLSPKVTDHAFLEQSIQRSIEVCGALGIPNNVMHFGWAKGLSKEESFEKNSAFCRKFLPTCEKHGVNILVENSCQINMGDMYYPNSAKDILEFLSAVEHPLVHVCWDTGHANCEGSQYNEIVALGKELYAIHYNDNHGKGDEHLMPYMGTMNNDEVISALIAADFKGYFTLECTSMLLGKYGWPHKRRPYEADERLITPPRFLQERMESAMYETAKYMLSSYGIFEE
ncbi:MAG: sugar phosphate isomerase/epimerase [Clostridia bacterium]|nr:sugar phosphate isomerase/epimerase [Clostridia bacterium]